jgi:hypothetical protein
MPNKDELRDHAPSAQPFHCLLEDDALIADFSVRTDRLLTLSAGARDQVMLIMDIQLRASRLTAENIGLTNE